MKHFSPSRNMRVIALLKSPMNAVGTTIPVTAITAPRHTSALILQFPLREMQEQQVKERYLCKISFLRPINNQTQIPNHSACGSTWFFRCT